MNLYEYGSLSSESMFGNDVLLLLGLIERGKKRKTVDEEKNPFHWRYLRGCVSVFCTACISLLMDHYGFLLQAQSTHTS
jgi:hypothetical protein